jgi:glycosyltransferase involved in cell wall biosynthesis
MSYLPNIDAMFYFYEEILPYIKRVMPNIEVWVVGINPAAVLEKLKGHNVHVTGRVDDVRPFYRRSSVCVIPLRAGGGTRLKILESMALGRPVVSTTIGCEGLGVEDGKHLFIADTAEEFAEKVLLLLANKEKRQQIINNARWLVETHYNWDILANKYIAALVHMINDLGQHGGIS